MKVIQFTEYGGPEVLKVVEMEKPTLGDHDVLVDIKAIGVNYADIARRQGAYVIPTPLPFIPGAEIAGIVSEVGPGVTSLQKGDRVVALIESGAYSEYVAVKDRYLIPLPEDISFEEAVALPIQGLSAYHILKTMGQLQEGETVLVHAASGGVGLLAVQLAKKFGAGKVIATASTPEKLALAEEMGADHLVNYSEDNWDEKILEITENKGIDVALEMVGGDVFHKTRKILAEFGRLVIFGVASNEQARFYPSSLMEKNQTVVGFFLPQIMKRPTLFRESFQELLTLVSKKELTITIGATYPLTDAAKVHQLFHDRKTTGKIVLKP